MSSRSNVWGIGDCMWSLLSNLNGDSDVDDPSSAIGAGAFPPDNQQPAAFDAAVIADYTAELRDLIMDCLEYLPDNRPTADEVLRRARAGIENNFPGLRDAASNGKLYSGTITSSFETSNIYTYEHTNTSRLQILHGTHTY